MANDTATGSCFVFSGYPSRPFPTSKLSCLRFCDIAQDNTNPREMHTVCSRHLERVHLEYSLSLSLSLRISTTLSISWKGKKNGTARFLNILLHHLTAFVLEQTGLYIYIDNRLVCCGDVFGSPRNKQHLSSPNCSSF
jgi:hypothetical protein